MASTRRTRFHFRAERHGELREGAILSYDAETVWQYLERRGHFNIEVFHAPKRRHPAAAQAPAWEVDRACLDNLAARLGVTWPVEVRRTAARGRGGACTMRSDTFGRKHLITVGKHKDPTRASEIIAHELTHAAQYERYNSWQAVVDEHKRQARIPYASRPWEVEAVRNEPLGRQYMPARAATRRTA